MRMSGFYSLANVRDYHAAVTVASEALPQPPARQAMICDISDMQIQSQEIVAAFQRVMGDVRYRQRPVAFVVASTLARMQLLRIIDGRTVAIFTRLDEAEAWLLSREAKAA